MPWRSNVAGGNYEDLSVLSGDGFSSREEKKIIRYYI